MHLPPSLCSNNVTIKLIVIIKLNPYIMKLITICPIRDIVSNNIENSCAVVAQNLSSNDEFSDLDLDSAASQHELNFWAFYEV